MIYANNVCSINIKCAYMMYIHNMRIFHRWFMALFYPHYWDITRIDIHGYSGIITTSHCYMDNHDTMDRWVTPYLSIMS